MKFKTRLKGQSHRRFILNAVQASLIALAATGLQAAEDEHHEHNHNHDNEHQSYAAHVHGEAVLNIVIDGELILAEFISPLENLLGFEHEPETAEQKQAYQDLLQDLADSQAVFGVSDARCTQTGQQSESPFTEAGHAHAEWHGEYYLECRDIGEAAHIKPQLFTAYPGVEKLTVQLISTLGQSQHIVTSNNDTIPLR